MNEKKEMEWIAGLKERFARIRKRAFRISREHRSAKELIGQSSIPKISDNGISE